MISVIPAAVAEAAIKSGAARKKIEDMELYKDQLSNRLDPSMSIMQGINAKVRKNPNGLEAVVANEITVNSFGCNHPMYKGKNDVFDAFCWHYDDTEVLPPNAKILSSNNKSEVQSVSFDINESSVWAVQYHPEFDPSWIAGLMKQREEILLKEGAFTDKKYFDEELNFFFKL